MNQKEQRTRERILEVAAKKFMNQGYKATSTRKISQEVGITQPNLYYHFKNKETLYIAVMESAGEEAERDLRDYLSNDGMILEHKLYEMTSYLQKQHSFNFYIMMQDLQEELSQETGYYLYTVFQKSYKQPFVDLFKKHSNVLDSNFSTNEIASYYFLLLAPYINPNSNLYLTLSIENIIEMFLHGIVNQKNNF